MALYEKRIFNSYGVVFLSPPQSKTLGEYHQRVDIALLGVLSPRWPHFHSMSSSCFGKLFVFFASLFSRRKLALPFYIFLDPLKSLLFNIEYS